jgi:hypothetical protein
MAYAGQTKTCVDTSNAKIIQHAYGRAKVSKPKSYVTQVKPRPKAVYGASKLTSKATFEVTYTGDDFEPNLKTQRSVPCDRRFVPNVYSIHTRPNHHQPMGFKYVKTPGNAQEPYLPIHSDNSTCVVGRQPCPARPSPYTRPAGRLQVPP